MSAPATETRLGPFFFTYRPHPGEDAITIPGYLIPFQWPPNNACRAPPYSSFVYTVLAQPPVQPVWSVSGDSLTQWNGAPPGPPSLPPPSSSYKTPATSVRSTDSTSSFGSPSSPSSHEAWLAPSPRLPPSPRQELSSLSPLSSPPWSHWRSSPFAVSAPSSATTVSPPSSSAAGGAAPSPPSWSYDEVAWTRDHATPAPQTSINPTVPEIAITEASNSTPSLCLGSIQRRDARLNGLTPNGQLTPKSAPPRSPMFTQPCSASSKMAISNLITDVPDEQLSELERELHIRFHGRKSIPTEWLIPARPPSPIEFMDVDEVPESPPLERPARPARAASSVGESIRLRRRRGQILRADRPASCYEYVSHHKLTPPPAVRKAKSMSALRVAGEGYTSQREVQSLFTIEAYRPSSPPPLKLTPPVLKDVTNISWPKGEGQVMDYLPLSPSSVDVSRHAKSLSPVRSPRSKNLCDLAKDPEPESPTPTRASVPQDQHEHVQRRMSRHVQPGKQRKSLDEVVAEGWNGSSVSNLTSLATSSTLRLSQSDLNSDLDAARNIARRVQPHVSSSTSGSGLSTIPTIPSRLLAKETSRHCVSLEGSSERSTSSHASENTAAGKRASSMNEAISSLAEMLKETLVITEPKGCSAHASSGSELEFDFEDDTMWSDELAIDDTTVTSEGQPYDQSQLEQAHLLEIGSPVLRNAMAWRDSLCLVDDDSDDADCEGSEADSDSPAPNSPHILDVERAFGRKRSFPPAPRGYVHIDEISLSSGTLSATFSSGVLTGSFGSVADNDALMQQDEADGSADDRESEVPIESGASPALSPSSCTPSPRKPPGVYERHGFLPTIAEVSEEESPIQSRFWNTRERLVSASPARGCVR